MKKNSCWWIRYWFVHKWIPLHLKLKCWIWFTLIAQKYFNIKLVLQLMTDNLRECRTYKVPLNQFIGLQMNRKHLSAQGKRTHPIQKYSESFHTRTPACLSTSGWWGIIVSAKAIWAQLHGGHSKGLEFWLDDVNRQLLWKFSWNQEAKV